jgi:hypothetical protein
MVARCVPRQVAYEVCKLVPVTVCSEPLCPTCQTSCPNGDCGVAPSGTYAPGAVVPEGTGADGSLRPVPENQPETEPEAAPGDLDSTLGDPQA